MKICFLGSAASIHTYRWVRYFADQGHSVDWLSLVPSTFDALPGVHLQVVGGFGTGLFRLAIAMLQARRSVTERKPDIVHAHYLGSYGLIGAAAAGRVPLVATAWGSDILVAGKSVIKRPFVQHVLDRAAMVTCDAYHMIDAIKQFGISPEKIHLVYFGIDAMQFCPGERQASLRNRLELGSSPTVISLRSLEPIYDIPTLVAASALVIQQIPTAKFVIVGTGSQRESLIQEAESLGISSSLRFVGRVANHDLPSYLRAADVYVSTALSDGGLSASTAEAMACAVPVVATDCAENNKWIESGWNGYLVPTRSPSALAERIVELLRDSSRRSSMGAAGRVTVESRLDYQSAMSAMEGLYRSLLSA